ncbi:MAG: EAL domain-containing protein [Burkholderiaceae bacterium]
MKLRQILAQRITHAKLTGGRQMLRRTLSFLQGQLEGGLAARALQAFAIGAVPMVMAALTLVSFAFWPDRYAADSPMDVSLRVIEAQHGETPDRLLAQITHAPAAAFVDTRLSTRPFWMLVDLKGANERGTTVAFPSRHARTVACWDVLDLNAPLARADRGQSDGVMRTVKSGFAIEFAEGHAPSALLCEGLYEGPARIRAERWDSAQFATSAAAFHRQSGLLEGGTLVLAAFVFLVALVNREWIYVLFAGWLVANFQLAAISAGFDWTWLGQAVPESFILPMRKAGIAFYCLLTIGLFSRLFSTDLKELPERWMLVPVQWSGIALLIAAFVAPFAIFLPIMWASVALGVLVISFLLFRLLRTARSPVAMWYGASLALTLVSGLYEVLAAAFGVKVLIGAVNSVTAALASSLLAALAIAAQFRAEREKRVAAEAESLRASSKLESTYQAIPIGLFTADESGALLQTNPAFRALASLPEDAWRPSWSEIFPDHDWKSVLGVAAESPRELEVHRGAPNGEARWYVVHATRAGDVIEGSLQDVTERKTASDRLRFLADHDPLTGILNRRGIEMAFTKLRRRRNGRPAALAYLDLDRFKLINDLYGHPAGDEVLRQLCSRVRSHLADAESFARVGGDEFVILFHDAAILRAKAICTALVEAIEDSPFNIGEKAFQVKGSIGLIELDREIPFRDAVATADRACREAKAGRGRVVAYERDTELFQERIDELRLIERIGQGVDDDGLFLEMQPIMSLDRPLDSLNFEVLLRMRDKDNRIIPPGKIIKAADNNGRMAVIDRWVLERTLTWIEEHRERFTATHFICVNLSGSSLNDERFIEDAFAMLSSHPKASSLLCLEVTESVALHDLQNTGRFIDRAKSLGAKIALDDFGAGYSSFSYLRDLPADALKIDGAFVKGVSSHPANVAILQAIIELTHNLGMKSIAEWVEDLETLELLAELGADYAQGFAIARSQPAERLLEATSSAEFIADESIRAFVHGRKSIRKPPTPIRYLIGGRAASGR